MWVENRLKHISLILFLVIFMFSSVSTVLAAPAPKITVKLVSSQTINLETGKSAIVSFQVNNVNSYCGVTAYYSIDTTSYNNLIGPIASEKSSTEDFQVNAPPEGSGSGTLSKTIYIKGVEDDSFWCDGLFTVKTLQFVINYDDTIYQSKQDALRRRQAQEAEAELQKQAARFSAS